MACPALAEDTPAAAPADAATLALPATPLPYSDFASAAARERFIALQAEARAGDLPDPADLAGQRRFYQRYNDARLAEVRRAYAADVRQATLAGVPVHWVEPRDQPGRHGGRVLINLHGGAFMWGAGSGALVEAIPVSVVSGIPVVAVDYRLAPEHPYPAAVDDVEAVYRHLLKDHRAEDIGLYGCSAGGMLSAQAVARILTRGLPPPGAVATLCGTGLMFSGDALTLGQIATGAVPMSQGDLQRLPYLRNARLDDPVAFPGNDPALLARFPPTLLMAGSRDFSVSALTTMHRRLLDADATAELVVFDGLWHAFLVFPDLPESKEAYALIARFFDRHLGRAPH
jgi:acetyl esterase/lipase